MSSPDAVFELLTVREVAELLHCSKTHVSNVLAGRVQGCQPIPSVRLSRRTLVRRETLAAWIEHNEAANDNLESSSPERGVRKHALMEIECVKDTRQEV